MASLTCSAQIVRIQRGRVAHDQTIQLIPIERPMRTSMLTR